MTGLPSCARCGDTMNHHADKLTHAVTPTEAAATTDALDGVVERVFTCPSCGWTDSRREPPPAGRG